MTQLKDKDGNEKLFHLHKDGVIKEQFHEIVMLCTTCNKSITSADHSLSPETFINLDVGYPPNENHMLRDIKEIYEEGFQIEDFVTPTYAESLCLATVRVTASIHRVRMKYDYTDQVEGNKTMSVVEGNPICFEFSDELQSTLATYPRKLDTLSDSISVVFVGKVESIEHAREVVAKSHKLCVSTRTVTKWAELLRFMWEKKFNDTSVPNADLEWAGDHDQHRTKAMPKSLNLSGSSTLKARKRAPISYVFMVLSP